MPDEKTKKKLDLKAETIEDFRAKINKQMGKHTVIKGSDLARQEWPRITSGSLGLDIELGGGWPLNVWIELVGNESSGKTVLLLKTIAVNQAKAKAEGREYRVMWIASEDFVPQWAEKIGVVMEWVELAETNVMEQAFSIMLGALDNQLFDAVILDSYPALVPSEEAEKAMDEFVTAAGAKLMNKFLRKARSAQKRDLVDIENEKDVFCVIVNQWREKIGVMFGDPRTTPGGRGKNFEYFVRVEVARDEWLTITNPHPTGDYDKTIKVGQSIKTQTMKNKTAPPQRRAVVDFYFSDAAAGFSAGEYDTLKEVITAAISLDLLQRPSKVTYSYQGEVVTTGGRPGLEAALRENDDLREQITRDVFALTTRNGEPPA